MAPPVDSQGRSYKVGQKVAVGVRAGSICEIAIREVTQVEPWLRFNRHAKIRCPERHLILEGYP